VTELSTVPDLPYDPGALEPHISARITELHHDKHHAAYVKGANADPEEILSGFGSGGSRPACGDVPPPTTLPKPKSCPEGVDSLNAAIAGATNTSDIDASRALQSFRSERRSATSAI
jgi:Iron/manganese superoxide dismutases, alpha-hairpin domain